MPWDLGIWRSPKTIWNACFQKNTMDVGHESMTALQIVTSRSSSTNVSAESQQGIFSLSRSNACIMAGFIYSSQGTVWSRASHTCSGLEQRWISLLWKALCLTEGLEASVSTHTCSFIFMLPNLVWQSNNVLWGRKRNAFSLERPLSSCGLVFPLNPNQLK